MPSDIDRYMKACTQETSQEVITATVSVIMALHNSSSAWITAVIDGTEALNLDSDFLDASKYHRIQLHVILADRSIGKVVAYKIGGHQPAPHEIHKELPSVRKLLREWPKLKVGEDGLLRIKCGEYLQLVLPKQFYPLVYKELDRETWGRSEYYC